MDQRIQKMANTIVNYCCEIKSGERVFIDAMGFATSQILQELIKEIYAVGAEPFFNITESTIEKEWIKNSNKNQLRFHFTHLAEEIKTMDAYIAINGFESSFDIRNIDKDKMHDFLDAQYIFIKERLKKRYVLLKYPTVAMAQKLQYATNDFEDFYFDVCGIDYYELSKKEDALVELMNKTDKVKIIGENVNLEFSIKNINVLKCDGKVNLPGGEVFTAPVKDSVNGFIKFNTKSTYRAVTFTNIYLKFENGKIIEARANDEKSLNDIFNLDEGSRYVGEFAFGLNSKMTTPMDDILFDEKISGSIHLAIGASYSFAYNGNNSQIHWDIIRIMSQEDGYGEIYFDGVLVQKNGIFILNELKALNR